MNKTTAISLAAAGALSCALAIPTPSGSSKPHKYIPTFAHDVAPILYTKCASCHHAGEVAPFSITSYAEAKAKARTIAAFASRKLMPPWQAVSHGEFIDERTLTPAQIATLTDWADAGAPAGNLKDAPPSPKFTPGWNIGTPDFVGSAEAPYPVAAEGPDDYRCFVIKTHYPEDRYVTAIEVRPGNRKIVHHVLIYLAGHGQARTLVSHDGKPGYPSFGGPGFIPDGSLGGWAPGLQPNYLPAGEGFLLPKGADIVLQLHYHRDGKPETDLTRLGLKFAADPVDKRVRWAAIGDQMLDIPAGDREYTIRKKLTLPRDIDVVDVIPHMHWLGHDMTLTAALPDGEKKTLIDVDHYDFNWQTRYTYKHPIHLPSGTVVSLVAHYDNSSDNPRNPNQPPKEVTFGEQTTNEMCFAFFSYTLDAEHLAKGIQVKNEAVFPLSDDMYDNLFDKYNVEHDGLMTAPELTNLIRFFSNEPEPKDGKPSKAETAAKFLIALYGQTHKGALTKQEFIKLAQENKR